VWVSDNIDPLDRQQMMRWTTQLIPPELMGSHIASGRSHTTGRVHDLSFRAATAVFGHLGIEWDLALASEEELAELGDWISFFKAERSLLLGGDLVRLDFPDPAVQVNGVVAPDRSRAVYSIASLALSDVVSVGRLRLPGLAPERRYRVTPVLTAALTRALRPPHWWQETGTVFPGAVLTSAGLQAPGILPEHAVLLLVEAVD
jgi:alpha-galactosidase